ncbi:hypothetical protein HYV88_02990 [Candidatus Woesearchaeota archaeon]|nr:hypothetical protein [Candidatus Woesearchaeota archaeon]
MQKRGISELVGAVLVILIIVVLFVIVFFAFDVKKYVSNLGENPCDEVKIDVKSACYNKEKIIIKIENNGNIDVNNGFLFKIYGNEVYDIPSVPLTLLGGFGTKEINLPYEEFMGKLDKVVILPKFNMNNKQYICDSNLGGYKLNEC